MFTLNSVLEAYNYNKLKDIVFRAMEITALLNGTLMARVGKKLQMICLSMK